MAKNILVLNKTHVHNMIVESINKAVKSKVTEELPGRAKHIDYEISMLLEAADNKTEFCRDLLKQIDVHAKKSGKKDVSLEDFFGKLKYCLLGKLFYLSLKENKFLIIQNFVEQGNRQFVMNAVDMIESSQDNAIFFLDSVKDARSRDFFTGIISCIYS